MDLWVYVGSISRWLGGCMWVYSGYGSKLGDMDTQNCTASKSRYLLCVCPFIDGTADPIHIPTHCQSAWCSPSYSQLQLKPPAKLIKHNSKPGQVSKTRSNPALSTVVTRSNVFSGSFHLLDGNRSACWLAKPRFSCGFPTFSP